jgi:excinuclease ABC subunit A
MGPEGGRRGGEILSTGSPSEIAKSVKGYTPKYVKAELESR